MLKMTKKSFYEWLNEQRDRTDGVGEFARTMIDRQTQMSFFVYALINRQKLDDLKMNAIRAFVEYKKAVEAEKAARREAARVAQAGAKTGGAS